MVAEDGVDATGDEAVVESMMAMLDIHQCGGAAMKVAVV